MPAQSRKQQKWAFAMLQKAEQGENETTMTKGQLKDFTKLDTKLDKKPKAKKG